MFGNLRNPVTRNVALRLTLASILAMATAEALCLALPWWAAMAVWMIGQPPRGLLAERSVAQLAGTVLGAAMGAGLVLTGGGSSATTLLALVLWVALCAGVANLMRHQRAYGAAVCGLTSVVIVALTLDTPADPLAFALARVSDTLVGIAAALGVALLLDTPRQPPNRGAEARSVLARGLDLVAQALHAPAETDEPGFLQDLAALEARGEDAAAGSIAGRRALAQIRTVFACALDLIVLARALSAPYRGKGLRARPELQALHITLTQAAQALRAGQNLPLAAIEAASLRLAAIEPGLAGTLAEMGRLLAHAAHGLQRLEQDKAPRGLAGLAPVSRPHADLAGLWRAALRAGLVTLVAALLWLGFGGGALRFLLLGAGIFTVLFAAVDEPAPAVRHVLLGGLAAVLMASLWRLVLIPELANGWISLALAVPFVFAAALLQAGRGTMFLGLAFNMLFAVLARPVEVSGTAGLGMLQNEALLLAGIALNYSVFRWVLPMSTDLRRLNLRAAMRREILALARLAGSARGPRHLARLRFLVFGLVARAGARPGDLEQALAMLALGHALLQLGEVTGPGREIARQILARLADPQTFCAQGLPSWQASAPGPDQPRLAWILEEVAREMAATAPLWREAAG